LILEPETSHHTFSGVYALVLGDYLLLDYSTCQSTRHLHAWWYIWTRICKF